MTTSGTDGNGTDGNGQDSGSRKTGRPFITGIGAAVALTAGGVLQATLLQIPLLVWALLFVLILAGVLVERNPDIAAGLIKWCAMHAATVVRRAVGKLGSIPTSGFRQASALMRALRPRVAYLLVFLIGGILAAMVSPRLTTLAGPADQTPCPRPQELRAVTASENVAAFQREADAYAAQMDGKRCRAVHITVFALSSLQEIASAFDTGWVSPSQASRETVVVPFVGPQPDIWIADSLAEAEYVRNRNPADVTLDDLGPIGTSPLVFAVPVNFETRVRGNLPHNAATWRGLIDAARRANLDVARPDPDLSSVGLLATADLYRHDPNAPDDNAPDDPKARQDIEQKVASIGTPQSSVDDLLCSLRPRSEPGVAVLVTEQALIRYNRGDPLSDTCSSLVTKPQTLYKPLYPDEARSLDYRFTQVTWNGQADPVRDRLITGFQQWLGDGRLRSQGYRDVDGQLARPSLPTLQRDVALRRFDASEIVHVISDYPSARAHISVALVIDLSGSMNKPVAQQGSRLDRARDLALQALELLGQYDLAGLWTFPASRSAGDTRAKLDGPVAPIDNQQKEKIKIQLSALGNRGGGHSPLYDVIGNVTAQIGGKDNPAVLVFTDGDNSIERGASAADLIDRLRTMTTKPRVIIFAIGGSECESEDVAALTRADIGVECRPTTSGNENQLINPNQLMSSVFNELRKGGPVP